MRKRFDILFWGVLFYFIIVMRLGKKKEKDRDQEKEQFVDGVARLICSPNPKQSHPIPLRGNFLRGVLCTLLYRFILFF